MKSFSQRFMPNIVLALAVVLALSTVWGAVNQKAVFNRFVPAAEDALGRHYLSLLSAKNISNIEHDVDPSVDREEARTVLGHAADALPSQHLSRIDLIGYRSWTADSVTRIKLSYELSFPTAWAAYEIVLKKEAGTVTVEGPSRATRAISFVICVLPQRSVLRQSALKVVE